MRINLDIQDQNLTPEAKETLVGLLHRLEREPERFMDLAARSASGEKSLAPGELQEFLRKARAERSEPTQIAPGEFFVEILKTKGFKSKGAAHRHVREMRDEWD